VAFVQAGVIVPLYNRNQGNIRQAEADIRTARTEVERIELSLRSRLAEAYQRYVNADTQARRYQAQILPNAAQSRDLVRQGYEQGEFPFLRLLNSQRTFFETNTYYVQVLKELWQSRAEIDGLLLTGGLDSAAP
jgi:cobalt-zinc-cadmium efflux system outer membrane protein